MMKDSKQKRMDRAAKKKKAGTAPLAKKAHDDNDIEAFLETMDVELDSRCKIIKFEALRQADALRNAYHSELIKLPKNVRQMDIREFCEKYEGEIQRVLEHERKLALESSGFSDSGSKGSVVLRSAQAISRTLSMRKNGKLPISAHKGASTANILRTKAALAASARKNGQPSATPNATPLRNTSNLPPVYQTPRGDMNGNSPCAPTPATVLAGKNARPLKRGESIMSLNGSPLILSNFSDLDALKANTSALSLALAGKENGLDLSDPRQKEQTFSQLAAIKNQVASLMETINMETTNN